MTKKGDRIGKAARTGWIVSWDDVKKDVKKDIKRVQAYFTFNGPKAKYSRQLPLGKRRKRR
jgi:hypothetical protein